MRWKGSRTIARFWPLLLWLTPAVVLSAEEPPATTRQSTQGAAGVAGLRRQPPPDWPANALVFGMTPVVGVEATKARFARLTEHMSRQLDMPVELVVAESYGRLIERMVTGRVDLAKFSPLAYVRARKRVADLMLIATHVANGSTDYSSYLVTLHGNPHNSLKKIGGARVCFVDPDSTSGFLFPLAFLRKHRISVERDLASFSFGGDHRTCLKGLYDGSHDLAATWSGAIRDARSEHLDVGELVIVAKTGRIPYDAYCLRPGMDPDLARRIREVLLSLNTLSREGRRVLAPTLGINGWVPVIDDVYDGVRRVEAQMRRDDVEANSR